MGVVFSQHGEYDYWLEGRLLVVKATGAWNAETAHSYCKDIQAFITEHLLHCDHMVLALLEDC